MTIRFRINVGDWSHDGHSQSVPYIVEADADDVYAVRQAYVKAKKLHPTFDPSNLCSEYEENTIDRKLYDEMVALGCPMEVDGEPGDPEACVEGPDAFADLIVWFINLGAGREMCKIVEDDIPNLCGPVIDNGMRGYRPGDENLHVSFGYGLFFS